METFSALLVLCAGNSAVPVNSPHKGQWRGALMFSLICAWINGWVNNREASDVRRHRDHYDVTVMNISKIHIAFHCITTYAHVVGRAIIKIFGQNGNSRLEVDLGRNSEWNFDHITKTEEQAGKLVRWRMINITSGAYETIILCVCVCVYVCMYMYVYTALTKFMNTSTSAESVASYTLEGRYFENQIS